MSTIALATKGAWWSIVGPLTMTLILVRISGVAGGAIIGGALRARGRTGTGYYSLDKEAAGPTTVCVVDRRESRVLNATQRGADRSAQPVAL